MKKGFLIVFSFMLGLIVGVLLGMYGPRTMRAAQIARSVNRENPLAAQVLQKIPDLQKKVEQWRAQNGVPAEYTILHNGPVDIGETCIAEHGNGACLTKDFSYYLYCTQEDDCVIQIERVIGNSGYRTMEDIAYLFQIQRMPSGEWHYIFHYHAQDPMGRHLASNLDKKWKIRSM